MPQRSARLYKWLHLATAPQSESESSELELGVESLLEELMEPSAATIALDATTAAAGGPEEDDAA